MPSVTLPVTADNYQVNSSNWYTSDGGTGLYAGVTGDGDVYRILLGFSAATGYANVKVDSATLKVYRKDTYSDKTWAVRVVSFDGSDSTTVDSNVVTVTLDTGIGWKSINIASLMPALMVSAGRRLLLYSGGSGNTYAEIRPLEYSSGSYAAQIDMTYTYPLKVRVSGTWRNVNVNNMRVRVAGTWRKIKTIKVRVAGTWRKVF